MFVVLEYYYKITTILSYSYNLYLSKYKILKLLYFNRIDAKKIVVKTFKLFNKK